VAQIARYLTKSQEDEQILRLDQYLIEVQTL